MEIGIDSFAAMFSGNSKAINDVDAMNQLLERIEHADHAGLTYLGLANTTARVFLILRLHLSSLQLLFVQRIYALQVR